MYVKRIAGVDSFHHFKEDWNHLLITSGLMSPFFRHEWFASWLENFRRDEEIHVLIIQDKGQTIGVAPLMIQDRIWKFIASHYVSDYCDFMVFEDRKEEFYEELLRYINSQSPEGFRMELINIAAESPTLSLFPKIASRWNLKCVSLKSDVVPVLSLPKSYEGYLRSLKRKNRHELKRKTKKLNSLPHVTVKISKDEDRVKEEIMNFIQLHRRSSPEKKEFWKNKGMTQFFLDVVLSFSRERKIELYSLFSEERLLAALLNFTSADQIFSYNVAFDRDFARYSPGIFLFNETIKNAIMDKKERLNFLRGREKYKYFFGAKDSKIMTLKLYPEADLQ